MTANTITTTTTPSVITHHVDLDSGEDILTISGVSHRATAVYGSGSKLWAWLGERVFHATDWSGDVGDVTPLTQIR